MAGERFPDVAPGQSITAARANEEGRVLERVARMVPGTGLSMQHGASFLQFWATSSAKIATLKVTDDADAPVYLGVLRQYSFEDDEWSDGTKEWRIDCAPLGDSFVLSVDDYVSCYFDKKRGMFIPTSFGGAVQCRWGKLDEELATGSTATVSLWQKTGGGWDGWDEDSGENVTAYCPPTFNENVDSGTWVLVANMNGRWVVWDYCCEVPNPTYC